MRFVPLFYAIAQEINENSVSLGDWLLDNKYFLIALIIGIIALISLGKNLKIKP